MKEIQLELVKNRKTKTGFSSFDEIKQLDEFLKMSILYHDTFIESSSQRLTYTLKDTRCLRIASHEATIPQIILILNWGGINQ